MFVVTDAEWTTTREDLCRHAGPVDGTTAAPGPIRSSPRSGRWSVTRGWPWRSSPSGHRYAHLAAAIVAGFGAMAATFVVLRALNGDDPEIGAWGVAVDYAALLLGILLSFRRQAA